MMSPYFNDDRRVHKFCAFYFYLINLIKNLNSHENLNIKVLTTKLKLFPMKIFFTWPVKAYNVTLININYFRLLQQAWEGSYLQYY